MDDNSPGAGKLASAAEVERLTLAKTRGWLGELSGQIERDRQENRHQLLRYLVLIILVGTLATGLGIFLAQRSIASKQVEFGNEFRGQVGNL